MRILLVRHGRPEIPAEGRRPVGGSEGGDWCRLYDAAGIVAAPPPPVRLIDVAASAGCIVTSDRRRAIESAALLAGGRHVDVDPGLCEAGLPESLPIPIRLPPGAWVVLARIAWLLRWCHSAENVDMARERAARVASRLGELARTHGTVLVVGHGFFNGLIARALRRAGWAGPRMTASGYWSMAAYERR